MVEVDGVCVEDVGAAGCSGVYVFVELPGVEWGVVVVADGERDCVSGWWLETNPPAHQMLCECILSVCSEVEASAAVASSKGPVASAPPARRGGVGVVSTIVGG